MHDIRHWLERHESLLTQLGGYSVLALVLSLGIVAVLLVWMPADYFARDRDDLELVQHPLLRGLLRVLKNLIGAAVLLAGIAMLVLPGQGLLTILIGLILLDFPGKHDLMRRILQQPDVRRTIDRVRRVAGQPPLEFDAESEFDTESEPDDPEPDDPEPPVS